MAKEEGKLRHTDFLYITTNENISVNNSKKNRHEIETWLAVTVH
jgi:hypothetical protein